MAYIYSLFDDSAEVVVRAANVGSHFIVNNVFVSVFILLWVHGYLWAAEILLILNFLNLTSLYFRHLRLPFFAHFSAVAGPKAWNFIALYTTAAAAVNAQSLPARLLANIFVWGLLLYGLFFLGAFQDYVIGTTLAYLVAGKLHVYTLFLELTPPERSPLNSL